MSYNKHRFVAKSVVIVMRKLRVNNVISKQADQLFVYMYYLIELDGKRNQFFLKIIFNNK